MKILNGREKYVKTILLKPKIIKKWKYQNLDFQFLGGIMKENIYRNVYCGHVDASYVEKEVRLAGWVNSIRNLGGLLFITLRDETGIVQLISEDATKYMNINRESTVTVKGIVQKRTPDMVNKNMATGEIEVKISKLEVLGECENILRKYYMYQFQ